MSQTYEDLEAKVGQLTTGRDQWEATAIEWMNRCLSLEAELATMKPASDGICHWYEEQIDHSRHETCPGYGPVKLMVILDRPLALDILAGNPYPSGLLTTALIRAFNDETLA